MFYLFEVRTRFPDREIATELWRQARYFTILTTLLAAASFTRIALTARASPVCSKALTYWIVIVWVAIRACNAVADLAGAVHGIRAT